MKKTFDYGTQFPGVRKFSAMIKFMWGMGFWKDLCGTPGYQAWQLLSLYIEAAALLNELTGGIVGTVMSLGTALATQERRLFRAIKGIHKIYAHDLSMREAYSAAEILQDALQIETEAIPGEFGKFKLPPSKLAVLLGNHAGNLDPESLREFLIWIRESQDPGAFMFIEWTAPFPKKWTGPPDWRRGATKWPETPGLVKTVTTEELWYQFVGKEELGVPEVAITMHPRECADGGYELIFVATAPDGRQVIIAEFYRYTPATMVSICRAAGYEPVPNGLWQNGPSSIILLQAS